MYFNNDIKIHNFKNGSHFNNHLNNLFRTDSAQKWTNVHTAENGNNEQEQEYCHFHILLDYINPDVKS